MSNHILTLVVRTNTKHFRGYCSCGQWQATHLTLTELKASHTQHKPAEPLAVGVPA